MAIDLAPLWNFDRAEASEHRFRIAPETATGDDALILQTQIARTHGLRGDFYAHLDGLAIDALHMLAFVDTSAIDQLRWGREALAVVQASSQPDATRWEASIRNNLGYALHQLGRFDDALSRCICATSQSSSLNPRESRPCSSPRSTGNLVFHPGVRRSPGAP